MIVTAEFIEQGKSPTGGWTRGQLAALGVAWPPPKGWKRKVLGTKISDDQALRFLGRMSPRPMTQRMRQTLSWVPDHWSVIPGAVGIRNVENATLRALVDRGLVEVRHDGFTLRWRRSQEMAR